MHTTVTPWTKKEVATALRLYGEGHTFLDIAQTLRRTRGEVAGKLFRLRRQGVVEGRLVKKRPPPRALKTPKVRAQPQKPPHVPRRPQMATTPPKLRSSPPPPYQPPLPKPAGPPTIWEMDYGDCRFPIGRRDGDGPMVFCAKTVLAGSSWCPEHRAVVYTKRV
jgi:hypothetical protein